MNNFKTIDSGKAQLKDFYGNKESMAEVIRRRRRKSMESQNIPLEADSVDRLPDTKDDEEK